MDGWKYELWRLEISVTGTGMDICWLDGWYDFEPW
jgi:hypothetical protein